MKACSAAYSRKAFLERKKKVLTEELVKSISRLTKERDEARREVCNWSVGVGLKATSQEVAEHRGWDCFEETP